MDSPPPRPWQQFDRYAVTWFIAIVQALICLGFAGFGLYGSTKDYSSNPIDLNTVYLALGAVFSVFGLLAIAVVVALLRRSTKTSVFAIVIHGLLAVPGIFMVVSAASQITQHPEGLLPGTALAGPPMAVVILSIFNLKAIQREASAAPPTANA